MFILKANYSIPFFSTEVKTGDSSQITIKLSEHLSFLNKPNLFKTLHKLPQNTQLIIDGTNTKTIDYDLLELIYSFAETASDKKIKVSMVNIPTFTKTNSNH